MPITSAQVVAGLRELVNRDLQPRLSRRADSASAYHPVVAEVWRHVASYTAEYGAQVSALALAAAAGCGRVLDETSAQLGSAIELYSYGVLVHDDVFDRDDMRFGKPSFHAHMANSAAHTGRSTAEAVHYGQSIAVLAGSLMQSLAVETLLRLPDWRVAHTTAARLCEGYRYLSESQLVDIAFEDTSPTSAEWQQMATQRASMHIRTVIGLGALLAGAADIRARALDEAARALGNAFDIRDDLLDAFGDAKMLPSRTLRDILRLKKPLHYCLTLERGAPNVRRELADSVRDIAARGHAAEFLEETCGRVRDLMASVGLQPAADRARQLLGEARQHFLQAALAEPYSTVFADIITSSERHLQRLATEWDHASKIGSARMVSE